MKAKNLISTVLAGLNKRREANDFLRAPLALALSRRHHLALGVVERKNAGHLEWVRVFCFLRPDSGWIVDAEGVRSIDELMLDLGHQPFDAVASDLSYRPVTRREVVRHVHPGSWPNSEGAVRALLAPLGLNDLSRFFAETPIDASFEEAATYG